MKRFIPLTILIVILLTGCVSDMSDPTTVPTTGETGDPVPATTLPPETPEATTVPETTVAHTPVERLIQAMTVEEKVGQLFLARCPAEDALADIQTYHLGGYILFGRDFMNDTPQSVRQTIKAYQQAADIPMLIAVDEEGGTVCRVSCYSQYQDTKFPSPRRLYQSGGMEAVLEAEREKATLLLSLGINVNMAPVCDVTTDPDSFMYSRSLGQSPQEIGIFASNTHALWRTMGMGAVLKHFPGYGNNADTHTGIAIDSRSLESLQERDLIPFQMAIDSGCGAILVSHTIVEALDPEVPASLSPQVHRYLRQDMGFCGVIVTDDLVMQAITDQYGTGEAAVLAVLAGNDLLCSSEYPIQYEAVLEAVRSGRISQELLDNAVARILQWKHDLGLLE